MTSAKNTEDRVTIWLRWIARVIGSFVAAFWLFAGVASAVIESRTPGWEDAVMATLIVASALSVVVAWWREKLGGAMVVICAIAHSTFAYIASGHNKGLAMLISGGPFLLIGVLFLASWWKSRKAPL